MLSRVAFKLTREQLGAAIIGMLEVLETQGVLQPAVVERVSRAEMEESWFRHMGRHAATPSRSSPYYAKYVNWLKVSAPCLQGSHAQETSLTGHVGD